MGMITDGFATAFRDYVTAGVPATGEHDPVKSEIRAIGPLIESALGDIGLAGLVTVMYATKAALVADLAHPANSVGLVYADATDANNDLYVKVGAGGSGSWTNTEALHLIVGGLAQPYVDDAEAAAAAAAASAAEISSPVPDLRAWLRAEAYTVTSTIAYNALGRPVSPLNIVWPDGKTGVLTITYNLDGTVSALSATYAGTPARTVAQPTITYSGGVPTDIPAITVS